MFVVKKYLPELFQYPVHSVALHAIIADKPIWGTIKGFSLEKCFVGILPGVSGLVAINLAEFVLGRFRVFSPLALVPMITQIVTGLSNGTLQPKDALNNAIRTLDRVKPTPKSAAIDVVIAVLSLAVAYPFQVINRQCILDSLKGTASSSIIQQFKDGFNEVTSNGENYNALYKGFNFHCIRTVLKALSGAAVVYSLFSLVSFICSKVYAAQGQGSPLTQSEQRQEKSAAPKLAMAGLFFSVALGINTAVYPLWLRSVSASIGVKKAVWHRGILFYTPRP
eukprot:TRINITY_DN1531_c0_g1_i1.p1 TRINITY_DN1531_c0_g1~~TRINITY_DN1531_c0_g1_i1.p1  ORF type:complete len:280 (+),score=33.54 TRINITY_DN1531_c0_g1_i1:92-931(+)